MAPTIGRVALDNGFHGSIPGDWVAPPPQNIQFKAVKQAKVNTDIRFNLFFMLISFSFLQSL